MFFFRSIYTKTYRNLIAKIPVPPNPFKSAPIKLSDGSTFYSLNDNLPNTSNCPIIPNKGGEILQWWTLDEATKAAKKYKSVTKFCAKFGVSRSCAINKFKIQKEKLDLEEKERIEGLNLSHKRGLVMRRLTRQDRFRSF